jgi:hypothetical protein
MDISMDKDGFAVKLVLYCAGASFATGSAAGWMRTDTIV